MDRLNRTYRASGNSSSRQYSQPSSSSVAAQSQGPLHQHYDNMYTYPQYSYEDGDDRPHVPIRTTPSRISNSTRQTPTPPQPPPTYHLQPRPQQSLSSHSTRGSSSAPQRLTTQRRRPPLVLDAASPHLSPRYMSTTFLSPPLLSGGVGQQVRPATTSRIPAQQLPPPANQTTIQSQQQQHQHNPPVTDESALAFARQAPLAGYLNKRGRNIEAFKRRFFVLQPATHLYYFLTAHDMAPRGCLDLHGARVERLLDDNYDDDNRKSQDSTGVYRFALVWDNEKDEPDSGTTGGNNTTTAQRRIVLEARSRADADQWMQALEEQRLSHCQQALRKAQLNGSAQRSRISELEQQIAQFKHMEAEKCLAEQEAAQWQRQFERLDEAIRKLTRQLLRPSSIHQDEKTRGESDKRDNKNDENAEEEKKDDRCTDQQQTEERKNDSSSSNVNDDAKDHKSTVEEVDEEIDMRHVPGTYFAGLANTVEQLRENLRLASDEASTAVEDVVTAQAQVQAVQARMQKAEQHLCRIWEENCALRKQLKQKKREKRVLVREVMNLRQAARAVSRDLRQSLELSQEQQQQQQQQQGQQKSNSDGEEDDNGDYNENADDEQAEEQLIKDLEKHVQSSLRLHEEFMAANGEIQAKLGGAQVVDLDTSLDVTVGEDDDLRELLESTVQLASSGKKKKKRQSSSPTIHPSVPLFENVASTQATLPVASLFDQSDEDDDESDALETESLASSVGAEAGDVNDPIKGNEEAPCFLDDSSVEGCSLERPNPLLELDEEVDDGRENQNEQPPHLCATFSQSESSSAPAKRRATSQLSCPYADVVSSDPSQSKNDNSHAPDDLRVYHLTFYSRRIGIQFQKVPPPPAKSRGLLTDAVTADLANVSSANEKTAAELRRIAAISTRGKSSEKKKGADGTLTETSCAVATPIDAVLVCGFEGFDDDSGNNERPKLGARLVAFDGVSIEVGQWTFESVRKSIQARGRPLTLSFRNDFLTTEQRRILTKAVQDMQRHASSPPATTASLPPIPTTTPSSAHGSAAHSEHDEMSASATSGSDVRYSNSNSGVAIMPQSFSGAASRGSSNSCLQQHRSSFSEVQSTTSSSVLSAVAPLVSNLLTRSGKQREPFTPEYLKRAPESVEETPQHQDFQSELL